MNSFAGIQKGDSRGSHEKCRGFVAKKYNVSYKNHIEICNFADNNTICSSGTNMDGNIIDLEEDLCQALEWFESNRLVANPSKFQMMLLGAKRNDKICMDMNGATVCQSASVKLLVITIDAGLKFDQHVKIPVPKSE